MDTLQNRQKESTTLFVSILAYGTALVTILTKKRHVSYCQQHIFDSIHAIHHLRHTQIRYQKGYQQAAADMSSTRAISP